MSRTAASAAAAWSPALAVAVVGGWSLLASAPALRGHLVPASLGDSALWAFALPNLTLLVPASLAAAWQLRRGDVDAARFTAWLITGLLAGQALWSLAATLLTGEAPLGPLLLLPAAFTQAVLGWTLQPEERWFRVAAPASVATRAAKTAFDAGLFTVAFLIVAPALLRVVEDTYGLPRAQPGPLGPLVAAIAALNAAGLASGLWMVKEGDGTPLPVDTAATLVVRGPYAHLRNPMAATGIAQGVLLAWAAGSWLTLGYAIAGGLFWHGFVRPIEEADLVRRFGAPYEAYQAAVPLWWPRLRPYRP